MWSPSGEREEPVPQGRVPFYLNQGSPSGGGVPPLPPAPGGGGWRPPGRRPRGGWGLQRQPLSLGLPVLGAERASAVDIDPKAVDVAL